MIKVLIILAAAVATVPCYAQDVRVFSGGGIEHVYGPGGAVLDSPELRAKNEQIRHQLREQQWDASKSWDAYAAVPYGRSFTVETRRQTPRSWWAEVPRQPPLSAWSDTCNAWTNC